MNNYYVLKKGSIVTTPIANYTQIYAKLMYKYKIALYKDQY